MTDCIVMTDDSGASRGFGFVTYTDKAHADAAIKELDGHRLHGRRIGVRDADNKEKRSKGPAKGSSSTSATFHSMQMRKPLQHSLATRQPSQKLPLQPTKAVNRRDCVRLY